MGGKNKCDIDYGKRCREQLQVAKGVMEACKHCILPNFLDMFVVRTQQVSQHILDLL